MNDRHAKARAAARNPKSTAPTITLDLSREHHEVDRDLVGRFPKAVNLWWELEPDQVSGFVYAGNKVLAKLAHGEAS